MPAEFHFLRPLWLLALLPLGLLLWRFFYYSAGDGANAWRKVCDAHLLRHLLAAQGDRRDYNLLWLLGLGWLIAVLALAGPTWSRQPQPVMQTLDGRVIVLDLSRSMLATDLKPSRLVRARLKIADILQRTKEGQTGLVVFAGDAFVVSPLSTDAATISALLSPLEPSIMPVQGSRADLGLRKAAALLRQAGLNRGEILLITDDSNGESALAAARELDETGYRLSVLGVGTPQGAPIPADGGGFVKSSSGEIVMPRLHPGDLEALAAAGGGRYASLSADDSDIALLMTHPSLPLNRQTQRSDRTTDRWREEGPWLVLLLLPLAASAFRKGFLMVLFLIVIAPRPVWAFDWADLWARPDQQAARALEKGATGRALELAKDPMLRGTAAYRAGDYQQAVEAFAAAPGADGHYNRGNALAQLGRYQKALAAYDAALAQKPDMEDARHNRKIIEELLRRQQSQQQPQQNQKQNKQTRQSQQKQGNDQEQKQQQNKHGGQSASQDKQNGAKQAENNAKVENEPEPSAPSRQQTPPSPPRTEPSDRKHAGGERQQAATASDEPPSEEEQAREQWLRSIPDDPGGLLRRKFLYQYRRRGSQAETEQGW